MVTEVKKILLIRFSSFGDVTQCLSVPTKLAALEAEIHWVTRSEFEPLLKAHPHIQKIWTLNRREGFWGLFKLIGQLRKEKYTHIYDAHNNLRSHLICWFLQPPLDLTRIFSPPLSLRKSQKRWKRFLLFRLRINKYRIPFSGQRDLIEPLKDWGITEELPPAPQIVVDQEAEMALNTRLAEAKISSFIALAPSAAHALKRWPMNHWIELVKLLPNRRFVVLGGTEDQFLSELSITFPEQVLNWAGKTNFAESVALVAASEVLITNDTGSLHIAEQLGKKAIALMGPAPFGFPSRESTQIMELDLKCRPCSKHGQGPCVNEKYQRCLVDILPEQVKDTYLKITEQVSH